MTSNTRFRPDFSSGRIDVPDVGGILMEFADRQANRTDKGLDRAIKQQQLEEEQRRWDITNSRAEDVANRQKEEANRALAEKNATNEAYRVLMNKDQYANEKMAAEQGAIQQSLANLRPQERAVAEQQLKSYSPEVSRQQWLDNAIGGPNVDQSKVLAMKANLYSVAANTPGTPEYEAKVKAELDLAEKKNDISIGGQLKVLDAQKAWEKAKKSEERAGLTDVYKALMTPAYEKKIVNADDIKNAEKVNEGIYNLQEKYGNKLVEFYQSSPMTEGPAKDAASRAYALNLLRLKEIPMPNTVPTARYEDVLKPKDVYTRELFGKVDPTTLNANALQVMNQRVADLYKEDPERVTEANKIAGYSKLLEDMDVATTGVKDSDVLKSMYDNEVEKRDGKSKGKTSYGPGAETLAAMNKLDIDTWVGNDQEKIIDVAKQYKITDKELAKLIEAADSNGWLPTKSGTVRKDVVKYIEDNYNKK